MTARQLQGKELSYNNIADADAAWECVKSFDAPACVIVKHANPCGVAVGARRARGLCQGVQDRLRPRPSAASSPSTAPLDGAAAQAVSKQFVEVLMAPDFTPEALEVFKGKANVRMLQIALPPGGSTDWDNGRNAMDVKRVGSGLLMQTADNRELTLGELKVVTQEAADGRRNCRTCCSPGRWPSTSSPTPSCSARTA